MPETSTSAPPVSVVTLPTYPYLLTTKDVANLARCSERHVMNQVDEGLLPKVPNLGRSVRFHPRDVREFLGF